jgi:hypothetical protein
MVPVCRVLQLTKEVGAREQLPVGLVDGEKVDLRRWEQGGAYIVSRP